MELFKDFEEETLRDFEKKAPRDFREEALRDFREEILRDFKERGTCMGWRRTGLLGNITRIGSRWSGGRSWTRFWKSLGLLMILRGR